MGSRESCFAIGGGWGYPLIKIFIIGAIFNNYTGSP